MTPYKAAKYRRTKRTHGITHSNAVGDSDQREIRQDMRRILVQLAHPVLERSRVNRRLLAAIRALDGVTINDLYEAYPTLAIDVEREQELLLTHDVIVFQHPFYWYSAPAIIKEWQDLVLETWIRRIPMTCRVPWTGP